jgi:hypothetical protein
MADQLNAPASFAGFRFFWLPRSRVAAQGKGWQLNPASGRTAGSMKKVLQFVEATFAKASRTTTK